jgi:predicted transposase YbfD/YdcC
MKLLDLERYLVTIDAMGTQLAITTQHVEQNANYMLALKEHQGMLYEDVKDTFTLTRTDHFWSVEYQFHVHD